MGVNLGRVGVLYARILPVNAWENIAALLIILKDKLFTCIIMLQKSVIDARRQQLEGRYSDCFGQVA